MQHLKYENTEVTNTATESNPSITLNQEIKPFQPDEFDKLLLNVMKSNPGDDTIKGIEVLVNIIENLIKVIEPNADVSGVERSNQYKVRTIFS